jgi:hypothetical protein
MSQNDFMSERSYKDIDSFNNEYKCNDNVLWKLSNSVSPLLIEHYLSGIDFPITHQELIERAKLNNAPIPIVNMLEKFKQPIYHCHIDISKEFSRNSRKNDLKIVKD